VLTVSRAAQAIIQDFNRLPPGEQMAVTPLDHGPLSDEDLTAIAAESFAMLDEEEKHGQSR